MSSDWGTKMSGEESVYRLGRDMCDAHGEAGLCGTLLQFVGDQPGEDRQTCLPAKRTGPRSGILRAEPRDWPRHKVFLRGHHCCVPDCLALPIDAAHIRSAANAGIGIKPHDAFCVPLCRSHHVQQHQIGQPRFDALYRIELLGLVRQFVWTSPDRKMRESVLRLPDHLGQFFRDELGIA